MQKNFEDGFPSTFSGYLSDYNLAYYEDLCNNKKIKGISCQSNVKSILEMGSKTSITGLLSDAKQIIITYSQYGNNVTLDQRKS